MRHTRLVITGNAEHILTTLHALSNTYTPGTPVIEMAPLLVINDTKKASTPECDNTFLAFLANVRQ